MYQKERMEEIYDILKKNGYVTVKYLVQQLEYSNATINRDLTVMENQKLIRRSYGGVELAEAKSVPLIFRYHKMKSIKNKMGKAAADLIADGDTVFIDGSSTTECIGRYITEKKDLTVITNNAALVLYLSEFPIRTICLGGSVVEPPSMLGGEVTVENAMRYHADKSFFSEEVLSETGEIGATRLTPVGCYHTLRTVMRQNAKMSCCIIDHEKVGLECRSVLCHVCDVDCLITDYAFDEEQRKRYAGTKILTVT